MTEDRTDGDEPPPHDAGPGDDEPIRLRRRGPLTVTLTVMAVIFFAALTVWAFDSVRNGAANAPDRPYRGSGGEGQAAPPA